MSIRMLAVACASVLGAGAAWAAELTDTAKVVSALPVYETVNEPTQECWGGYAPAPRPEPRSWSPGRYLGPVLGGVTGGLIGSQIGSGNGQVAATAVGAAIGAIAGDRVTNPDSRNNDYWGPIIGGTVGGLLGSQIGEGTGQLWAAGAGAMIGALAGDWVGNRRDIPTPAYVQAAAPVQNCRTFDNPRTVLKGYRVLYRYHGREAVTVLPYKPGPIIEVGVSAIPSGQAPATAR